MSEHALSDVLFPVGAVLRDVAEGKVFGDPGGPVGADNKASRTAMQNARRNPSGIDMGVEAQKAAARAGVKQAGQRRTMTTGKAPAPAAPAAPSPPADSEPRDHYAPRAAYGKISNND